MNRRGFISLLAGAAGALALPAWRRELNPIIFIPARQDFIAGDGVSLSSMPHPLSNTLSPATDLSEAALEQILIGIRSFENPYLRPDRIIVTPEGYALQVERARRLGIRHPEHLSVQRLRDQIYFVGEAERIKQMKGRLDNQLRGLYGSINSASA